MDDVIGLLFGIAAIIFNKRFARGAVAFQYRLTGKRYQEVYFRIGYIAIGAVFVIEGLSSLLGYTHLGGSVVITGILLGISTVLAFWISRLILWWLGRRRGGDKG